MKSTITGTGAHANAAHDELVACSPPCTREVQFDEKWAFVSKKQRAVKSRNSRHGGGWHSRTDCRLARFGLIDECRVDLRKSSTENWMCKKASLAVVRAFLVLGGGTRVTIPH